jgi:hypothetical protein
LGIILNSQDENIDWDSSIIPMNTNGALIEEGFFVHYGSALDEETQRKKNILDATYEAADYNQVVSKCSHLTSVQKRDLFTLPTKQSSLFYGK